jgi:hypothetical protein
LILLDLSVQQDLRTSKHEILKLHNFLQFIHSVLSHSRIKLADWCERRIRNSVSNLIKWEWGDTNVRKLTEERGIEGNDKTKDGKDRLFIVKIWAWNSGNNIIIYTCTVRQTLQHYRPAVHSKTDTASQQTRWTQ